MSAEPEFKDEPKPKGKAALRQLPLFDGYTIDRFRVAVSGGVELEKTADVDAKFVDDALIGRKFRVTVEGYVHASAGKAPRDKEGAIKEVVKTVSLKVDSVDLSTFEVTEIL